MDIKTIHALGGQSASVCTGVFFETEHGQRSFSALDARSIDAQLDFACRRLNLAAIKVGGLPHVEVSKSALEALAPTNFVPVVVDLTPHTSDAVGPENGPLDRAHRDLLSHAALITLGCEEASVWADRPIRTATEVEKAAHELCQRWGTPVLVTGGDLDGDEDAVDVLSDGMTETRFHGFRLQIEPVEGKGDCLSAAITMQLGWGANLEYAIAEAKRAVAQWMLTPTSIGPEIRVLCPSAEPVEESNSHP